jgi:hypothetical protein
MGTKVRKIKIGIEINKLTMKSESDRKLRFKKKILIFIKNRKKYKFFLK